MKKNMRFLGLALAGVVALLLPLTADAACGSDLGFAQYGTKILGTSNSSSLRSNFWIVGSGNPTLGAGNDNGAIQESLGNWLIPYNGAFGLFGNWGGSPFDGCPELAGLASVQRMAVSLSDVDGQGRPTFAVVCVKRDPAAATQFDFDTTGGDITLVPAPKPVYSTLRVGNEAQITVAPPTFSAGVYNDGTAECSATNLIPQYDVYKQQIGRGLTPNTNADASPAWTLVGTGTAGAPFQFTTTCGTSNCDVYLAVTPRFNSNFTTAEAATGSLARATISTTATDVPIVIQAGPTLAVSPKPKVIKNRNETTSKRK